MSVKSVEKSTRCITVSYHTSIISVNTAKNGGNSSRKKLFTNPGNGTELKINFNTMSIGPHTGYGNASRLLVEALKARGVEISPDADIVLNFCMPDRYKFGKYTIGYTPWESTTIPASWREPMMRVDDLWTTSSWTAKVFAMNLERHRPFVLPHGIEKCWKPNLRVGNIFNSFRFLHVGEPAIRKGGDIVLAAWHKAFRNRKDVRLTYKCQGYPAARVKDETGSIIASPGMIDNVDVITQDYTQEEMWLLYFRSHCLLYPTRGEGFGLIPFEAMATGLPTILPEQGGTCDFAGWSLYYLSNSTWVESTDQRIHPGLWMDHDLDELIAKMEYVVDHRERVWESAFQQSFGIHENYSWEKVADDCIGRIKEGKTYLGHFYF